MMAISRRFGGTPSRTLRAPVLAVAALGLFALVLLGMRGGTSADAARAFQPPPTQFECRWTDTPVTLDGKADEAAWKHAQLIDRFYLPWLGAKARAAHTATKARLLWDREYLYF